MTNDFKAINERDKELRTALIQTSLKQIGDVCTLTEKYLLEDDDRVAFSGSDFTQRLLVYDEISCAISLDQH